MSIIGQEKICGIIDCHTLDSFPRTIMLVGARGSGKHLICNYIAQKFNLITLDISENLDLEFIDELYNRVEPYLYIIRINEISVKEENTILKFIEEPLLNSYIVLIAETDNGILQTILNRCQIWYLQNYNKDFLRTFLTNDNEYILEIANTPGQVKSLCENPFNEMVELADKMITKIEIASIPNTLSLGNKIAWKDEKEKFNLSLFIKILLSRIEYFNERTVDIRYSNAYLMTLELSKKIVLPNVDCKYLFDKYLIELRTLMRGSLI